MDLWLGIGIGVFIGANLGVVVAGLLASAGKYSREEPVELETEFKEVA